LREAQGGAASGSRQRNAVVMLGCRLPGKAGLDGHDDNRDKETCGDDRDNDESNDERRGTDGTRRWDAVVNVGRVDEKVVVARIAGPCVPVNVGQASHLSE